VKTAFLRAGAGLLIVLLLAACGRESAREAGLEWKATPLEVFERVDAPSAERLRAEGFPVAGSSPDRLLKVAPAGDLDTLVLLDFPGEARAYAVFQELATHPGDFAEGFAEIGERVYFRRGRWIGSMPIGSWNGPGWLESDLSLPGAAAGSSPLPPEFSSLLRQKRFEGSERILAREFAGLPLAATATVYAAQYDCRGDSAWIYASAGVDRAFGLALARQAGWKADSSGDELEVFALPPAPTPFRLRFSGKGMAGVEGCFDSDLTSLWLKMQSRGLKSLK